MYWLVVPDGQFSTSRRNNLFRSCITGCYLRETLSPWSQSGRRPLDSAHIIEADKDSAAKVRLFALRLRAGTKIRTLLTTETQPSGHTRMLYLKDISLRYMVSMGPLKTKGLSLSLRPRRQLGSNAKSLLLPTLRGNRGGEGAGAARIAITHSLLPIPWL